MEPCPRTGQPCPKPKVTHVTLVGDDNNVEGYLHYCQDCLSDKPKQPQGVKMGVFDLLMLFYKSAVQHQQSGGERPDMPRCLGCQVSLAELARQPRVGCGQCYVHFRDQLLPVIKKAHGGIKHVGKVPKRWLAEQQAAKEKADEDLLIEAVGGVEARLEQLEENLKLCVQNEDYEMAAQLRDEIKRLKPPA